MTVPYRTLYSNDTTNILSCTSPFNHHCSARTDPVTREVTYDPCGFTTAKLQATVDETAGVGIDVHLMQPGVGWVPWWKSAKYPFEEHIRFMKEFTGMDPEDSPYAKYMAEGGDMVDVFCRRCRDKDLAPFVSFRLNDSHGHEFVDCKKESIPPVAWHCFSPVHVSHPEWRLGEDINNWHNRVLNWAIPEVVAHKLSFIEEIIAQYDIDGFELDFMRHCHFFRDDGPDETERLRIMTEFVGKVRAALDKREAIDGQHRCLCVRIPAFKDALAPLGIDIAAFAEAGVEMFNLSYYYFTGQQGDIATLRQQAPEAAFYVEMCHCTEVQQMPSVKSNYMNFGFRRTTPQQYYTTAHLAYARGVQGISTFNFAYYREQGPSERGPFDEPPFEIHRGCRDPDFVARQSQHYFIGRTWAPHKEVSNPMNGTISSGETLGVEFDMAPPTGGWQEAGRLRVQLFDDLGSSRWRAVMNGVELEENPDRSEPYDNPYTPLLGTPEQHRAWTVPAELPVDGINEVQISVLEGPDEYRLAFLDIALESNER